MLIPKYRIYLKLPMAAMIIIFMCTSQLAEAESIPVEAIPGRTFCLSKEWMINFIYAQENEDIKKMEYYWDSGKCELLIADPEKYRVVLGGTTDDGFAIILVNGQQGWTYLDNYYSAIRPKKK